MADTQPRASSSPFPTAIKDLVNTEAQARGFDGQFALGILGAETNGDLNPGKTSLAGAKGLWQLMPVAVKATGRDPAKFDYMDPVESTKAGLDYVKILHDKYQDPVLTAAAYNYGEGNIDKLMAKHKTIDQMLEHLPEETQNYLPKVDKFSEGYLTRPSGKASAEPAAGSAQGAAPSIMAVNVAPGAPTPQPTGGQPPAPPANDMSGPGMLGSGAVEAASNVGGMLKNAAVGTYNMGTQFPRELGNYLGGQAGESIGNAVGLPPSNMPLPPSPDPMGAVNMVTLPLGVAGGRIANAAIGAGTGVLNVADALAREQAQKAGLNWNDLGSGERTSRVMEHVSVDAFVNHLPEIAASTMLGIVFGGKPKQNSLVKDVGDVIKPPPSVAELQLAAENKAAAEAYARKLSEAQFDDHLGILKFMKDRRYAGAQNDLIEQANRQMLDEFAGRVAPIEAAISHAEDVTGIPRLSAQATKLERQGAALQMRDRLKAEYKIPATDPSSPVYQELDAKYGLSKLPAQKANVVDRAMEVFGNDAANTGVLKSKVEHLTRSLSDPNNVLPEIRDLIKQAQVPGISTRARISLLGQIEQLKAQIAPPTVKTLTDRAAEIDAFRRDQAFKLANPVERKRAGKLMSDLSRAMRAPDGFVEQLMPSPNAAGMWQRANFLSRQYNNQLRTVNAITSAFGETSTAGGSVIRNKLVKNAGPLKEAFGHENYQGLLDLAREVDTLTATLPEPPTLTAKLEVTPWTPQQLKTPKLGEPPVPKTLKEKQADSAEMVIKLTNLALSRRKRDVGGAIIGGIVGSLTGVGAPAGMAIGYLSGESLGFLATTPGARKAFVNMSKAARVGGVTSSHITSVPFMKAYARLIAASAIHDSISGQDYSEQIAPPPPLMPPQPPMGPPIPPELAAMSNMPKLPPIPGRPTGGPTPAPGSGRVGSGAKL